MTAITTTTPASTAESFISPSSSSRAGEFFDKYCKDLAIMTCVYAVAAAAFTSIGFVGGAVFGIYNIASSRLIHEICNKISIGQDNLVCKITKRALSIIGGIGISMLLGTFSGISITFTTALMLTTIATFLYRSYTQDLPQLCQLS